MGEGATCIAKLGRNKDGLLVALKLLTTKDKVALAEVIEREVDAMSKLNHENVLKLIEVDWNATYYDENQQKMVWIAVLWNSIANASMYDLHLWISN